MSLPITPLKSNGAATMFVPVPVFEPDVPVSVPVPGLVTVPVPFVLDEPVALEVVAVVGVVGVGPLERVPSVACKVWVLRTSVFVVWLGVKTAPVVVPIPVALRVVAFCPPPICGALVTVAFLMPAFGLDACANTLVPAIAMTTEAAT
jgi:hypothetical protein